jgi:transposase
VKAARQAWFEVQPDLDPDRLVFVDETAANTKMARRYGRAPRGQRCRMAVPQGHYATTTITAALRTSGPTALALFDGATNGARFRAYATGTLAPALKPGDTVILDNLQAHKVAGVCEAIEAAGARILYLPPYSPDFNPIEQVFAKLKALLLTAAARTVPDLRDAIRQAFSRFTPRECRNYLAASGYEDDLEQHPIRLDHMRRNLRR